MILYDTHIHEAIGALSRDYPHPIGDKECHLFALHSLLVLIKGEETTLKDVHDAFSIWRGTSRLEDAHFLPFESLSEPIQDYDRVYMEAIHRAATHLKKRKRSLSLDG